NPDATVDDLVLLAQEAQEITSAAPAEARPWINTILAQLLIGVLINMATGVVEPAVYKAVYELWVVARAVSSPVKPPQEPPAQLLPSPPNALTLPRGWHFEGLPEVLENAGPRASQRTLEFFTAEIRNPNTRQAYANA